MRLVTVAVAVAVAIGVSVAAVSSAGCINHGCDGSLMWGVAVEVTNDEAVGATVTIRDGTFVEVIEPVESLRGGTFYGGAGERAGTYEVTVEAPGYQTVVLQNVRVEDGECHVQTAQLEVQLQPL